MPTEVTRPTQRPHLSFSQVQLAAQCGEAYRRKYVEGEEVDGTNLPAMAGSAFHKAVERWETTMFRQGSMRNESFPWDEHVEMLTIMTKKALLEEIEKFPGTEDEIHYFGNQDLRHWRTEKLEGLAKTYLDFRQTEMARGWDWFGDEPSDMVEVEVHANIGGFPFKAMIDTIYHDSRELVVIRDLKTGEAKNHHTMQLEQYRLALKRATGIEADYGQLLYVKRKTPYVQVVDWNLSDDEVEEMAVRLRANVKGNTLMINGPFTGHCTVCDFRPTCPWGDVTPHGSS